MEEDGSAVRALEELSTLMTSLVENPFSERLQYQNVILSEKAGLPDADIEGARDMLTTFFAASDDIWLPLLGSKSERFNASEISATDVEDQFLRAERDYLSIPILLAHLQFLIDGNENFAPELEEPPPHSNAEFFAPEPANNKALAILKKAGGHTTEGHIVWNSWRDWWQRVIERSTNPERGRRVDILKLEYLKRLSSPHSTNDETFQAYSSFVSAYLPPADYERTLVHATQVRQPALVAWRNREKYQLNLTSPLAFQSHIAAEQRKRAKSSDPRVRDPSAILTLYERAIADTARRKSDALRGSIGGTQSGSDDLQAAEAWLSLFWTNFVTFLQDEREGGSEILDIELEVLGRSVRSLPASGDLWTSYIRALELYGDHTKISEVYQSALNTRLLSAKAISDVSLAAARPTYRRLVDEGDSVVFVALIEHLDDGIKQVRDAGGDSRIKLEKLLVHVLLNPLGIPSTEAPEPESIQAALSVWEQTARQYRKHWHVLTNFVDFLTTSLKDPVRARKAFKDAQGGHLALDYPEAVYEAWIAFEEIWGTSKDLEYALGRVRKMSAALNEKRNRDSYKASQAQAQITTEESPQTALTATAAAAPSVEISENDSGAVTPLEHELSEQRTSKKRKAEDEAGSVPKKSKPESPSVPLKRDREKSTVFVGGLQPGVENSALENLFKDCGEIREIKISNIEGETVATVEFQDRESVPAALTKDKKRIDGDEVAVHLAWESTLYVTNFPEQYDDASVRELFGKYGRLFDVRWPSKKFKNTRRFCYVQYISPVSAKTALILDRFQLEPGRALSVAISDPERKKERTDVGADQREVYVAGLSRFVTKEDLEALFSKFGTIKDVRISLDADGRCKGFAFVEFEQDASASGALAANNHDLKKRRIAVTLADSRVTSRKPPPSSGLTRQADAASRTVRIRNLPEKTQEGLLQQALEKHVEGIKKLEVFEDINEALLELESQAEAGKLLLLPRGVVQFQDVELAFEEGTTIPTKQKKGKTKPKTTAPPAPKAKLAIPSDSAPVAAAPTSSVQAPTTFVPRAAKSKPRAGVGHTGVLARGAAVTSAASTRSDHVEKADGAGAGANKVGKDQDAFRKMLGDA